MRSERALHVALTFGAALLLLWSIAATTDTRQTAPSVAVNIAASAEPGAAPLIDETAGVARLLESALAFVREISGSLDRSGGTGAVLRLLIVVEVLIATLGAVSCLTVRGKVKADLVYRIVDVMGALFILIALLLIGLTAV